jgi:type IV pilus assembly protein PilY1
LSITPNLHTGSGDGSKAFVQTSTGAIIGIKEANPEATKSGGVYWLERMEKEE